MNIDSLAAATGMPSGKKTHRGRRSRGKGLGTPPSGNGSDSPSTQTHLASINATMASGDHASAKKSALALVNALHKSQKKAVATAPLRPPGLIQSSGPDAVPQGQDNQVAFGQ